MARRIEGQRTIITGASSGIGRGLAMEGARRKMRLVLSGRDEARLNAVTEECRKLGAEAIAVVGDITVADDRERLIRAAESAYGGLDILVNNAGRGATGHFQIARPDRLRLIFELNVFAACELTRLAIPLLKKGTEPGIVMINSVAGRRAIPSRSEYSASKFALAGFTEALRAELSKDGIFVCSMNPGLTESNFESNMIENTARRSLHAERSMTSDECGRLIWNGYRSGRIESTFTLKARSLILMNRFFPRLVDFLMCRFVKKLYAKDGARSMEAAASG